MNVLFTDKYSNITYRVTLQVLRHSFTIYLLNNAKRPINEVQQLLSIQIKLLHRYIHMLIVKILKMGIKLLNGEK